MDETNMAPFGDSFVVNIYVALGLMMIAAVAGLFYVSVTSIAASIVLTVTFVVVSTISYRNL